MVDCVYCFVHGQGQKSKQKHRTKIKFPNNFPCLLTMIYCILICEVKCQNPTDGLAVLLKEITVLFYSQVHPTTGLTLQSRLECFALQALNLTRLALVNLASEFLFLASLIHS